MDQQNSRPNELHPAMQELLFEMRKLLELDLTEQIPSLEMIEELQETFPKLQGDKPLPSHESRLVAAAKILIRRSRQFELLDEETLESIQRSVRRFD